MAGERTYPVLPCPDLDEAIAFYEALGFVRSYRQLRPNPYAVLAREDWTVHLVGVEDYDPTTTVGSVVVVVPDAEALYADFVRGLRERCGRLPSAGVPRILRLRRKQGTATGFSVVDPGGTWLRVYQEGATEDTGDEGQPAVRSTGLARALEVSARQGDARGDDAQALAVLDRALERHRGAAAEDRVRALAYRVELLVRLGRTREAAATLAEARGVRRAEGTADAVSTDLLHAEEVLASATSERRPTTRP